MFPFFSYIHPPNFSLLFILLFTSLPLFPANTNFTRLLHLQKGTRAPAMSDLKSYFHRFGYLQSNFSDLFDDDFEAALLSYQKNLGLSQTGQLDHDTMNLILTPRCGVRDPQGDNRHEAKDLMTTGRYAYFNGSPRWARARPMTLTYAFSADHTIDYVPLPELKAAFGRAFARWSAVIPVNFTEAEDYSFADVRIGWYRHDHGDGEAFDGVLGVLAHAFSPENGRFHLDAAERWAVNLAEEKSDVAVDLESVATHEIGHVLGMAHSSEKEAIMYPSLSPRTRKVELRMDDVAGIQALYGSNPNYKYESGLGSDLSGGQGMDWDTRKWSLVVVFLQVLFSL